MKEILVGNTKILITVFPKLSTLQLNFRLIQVQILRLSGEVIYGIWYMASRIVFVGFRDHINLFLVVIITITGWKAN